MDRTINAKQLRASLPQVVERVRPGERFTGFTVVYRSQPAFRIVPVNDEEVARAVPLEEDPLFRGDPVVRSTDGLTSKDYDRVLYGANRV